MKMGQIDFRDLRGNAHGGNTMRQLEGVLAILVMSASSAGTSPLPKTYGVFVEFGNRLIELERIPASDDPSRGWDGTFAIIPKGNILHVNPNRLSFIIHMQDRIEPSLLPAERDNGNYRLDFYRQFSLSCEPIKGQQHMYRLRPKDYMRYGAGALVLDNCNEPTIRYAGGTKYFKACYYIFEVRGAITKIKAPSGDPFPDLSETKRNLLTIQSAISIYYGEREGEYPADLDVLLGTHLKRIPPTKLSMFGHSSSTAVEVRRGSVNFDDPKSFRDTGGWLYFPETGKIVPDCTHERAKRRVYMLGL